MAKIIPVSNLKNYVILILDKSGSMTSLKNEVVGGFNQNVEEIKKNNAEKGMETKICLVTFSTKVDDALLWLEDVDKIVPLTAENYIPDGMTAMYDAVGATVEKMLQLPDANDENTSFLVVIISDGLENNSKQFTSEKLAELVTACDKTGRWTFSYVGANQDLKQVSKALNINIHNMLGFAATADGYSTMTTNLSAATVGYYKARSAGAKNVQNMFKQDDDKDKDKDSK